MGFDAKGLWRKTVLDNHRRRTADPRITRMNAKMTEKSIGRDKWASVLKSAAWDGGMPLLPILGALRAMLGFK